MRKSIKKGDRYTHPLGKICVVKSVYRNIIKLQVLDENTYTELWTKDDFNKFPFIQIPMPKINRTNVAKYLLEFQLNMIGKTYYESKHTENWFEKWTITKEQYIFLRNYAIPLLKKIFKFNKTKAEQTFEWFYVQFGLKIKN